MACVRNVSMYDTARYYLKLIEALAKIFLSTCVEPCIALHTSFPPKNYCISCLLLFRIDDIGKILLLESVNRITRMPFKLKTKSCHCQVMFQTFEFFFPRRAVLTRFSLTTVSFSDQH